MKPSLMGRNNSLQVPRFHCSEDESHVSAVSDVQHLTKDREDEDVKKSSR